MCDVCKSEGVDYKFINFPNGKLIKRQLFSFGHDSKMSINVCYVHDIELFVMGETRFFALHSLLATAIKLRPGQFGKELKGVGDDDFF